MNNVKIEYQENKRDINGNKKFIYNFLLDGENLNHLFKDFGRKTNKGISSQYCPSDMEKILSRFCFWNIISIGNDLTRAQKNIDKCNSKRGCKYYCNSDKQESCTNLTNHAQLMNDLLKIQKFEKYKFN